MKKKIIFIGMIGFQICFVYLVFISSIQGSIMGIRFPYKNYINAFFPQGWGFFTKDPREQMIEMYVKEGENLQRIDFLNSDIQNYFGITRKSRRIGMDVGIIYEQLKEKEFVNDYKESSDNYLLENDENLYLSSHLKNKALYIVKKEWMPWAWYKNTKTTIKNKQYLSFHLK